MYYKISILETILINTKILNWNYERQSDIILNIQFIFVLCFHSTAYDDLERYEVIL